MLSKFELIVSAIVVILVIRSIALSGVRDAKQNAIENAVNDIKDGVKKLKERVKNAKKGL